MCPHFLLFLGEEKEEKRKTSQGMDEEEEKAFVAHTSRGGSHGVPEKGPHSEILVPSKCKSEPVRTFRLLGGDERDDVGVREGR